MRAVVVAGRAGGRRSACQGVFRNAVCDVENLIRPASSRLGVATPWQTRSSLYFERSLEGGVSVSIMKESVFERFPRTVEAAAEKILKGMSFQDKTRIANMGPKKLVEFHRTYGGSIQVEFRLPGNDPLMKSCAESAGLPALTGDQASYIILKVLWAKLQTSNVLKVVK